MMVKLWRAAYLQIACHLHSVCLHTVILFPSGEATRQRGAAGLVEESSTDKLVPLSPSLPLCHGGVQAQLQGIWTELRRRFRCEDETIMGILVDNERWERNVLPAEHGLILAERLKEALNVSVVTARSVFIVLIDHDNITIPDCHCQALWSLLKWQPNQFSVPRSLPV
jgi:hypothetical protein